MGIEVHLHGERVGCLQRCDDGYTLAYDEAAVERFGAGATLLSIALPLRLEPFSAEASRAYVEGLLPQGRRRLRIARELGISPSDGYALIGELGRDCIGAVTFLPEGDEAKPRPDSPAWLGDDELAELVCTPPPRVFDAERPQRMRFALPGESHKLALFRDEASGRWAWPEPGLPSTHVVKPEPAGRRGLAAVEVACTTAYGEIGLPTTHTELEEIAEVECLVSKRFDRWGDGAVVERLHQESFAQALGIAPDEVGENRLGRGTPSLGESCGLLQAIGEVAAIETLMHATFCDLAIGHAKLRPADAALLHGAEGPMLAPFYDIAATELYGDTRLRPIVIGPDVPPAPFLVDLVTTIDQCQVDDRQAALIAGIKLIGSLCKPLSAAADRAVEEGWHNLQIEDALKGVTNRITTFLQEEVGYIYPPDEGQQ